MFVTDIITKILIYLIIHGNEQLSQVKLKCFNSSNSLMINCSPYSFSVPIRITELKTISIIIDIKDDAIVFTGMFRGNRVQGYSHCTQLIYYVF